MSISSTGLRRIGGGLLLSLLAVFLFKPALAASYVPGKGDILAFSVWQAPELDRELRVDEDGRIVLPLVGAMSIEGRNLAQLEAAIHERLQIFNRSYDRVSLQPLEFNSRAVYVLGAVTQPGKVALWPMPDLWGAIREAGGAAADGDLSRVRLYHNRDGREWVETVDLIALFASGDEVQTPNLLPGETVEVPRRPVSPGSYEGPRNVYVFGHVVNPGVYPADSGVRDALGFILKAGGPLPTGDLSRVAILRRQADGKMLRLEVDLDRLLEDGDATQNPQLIDGDTIFVPRGGRVRTFMRENVGILTSLVTMVVTIVVATRN